MQKFGTELFCEIFDLQQGAFLFYCVHSFHNGQRGQIHRCFVTVQLVSHLLFQICSVGKGESVEYLSQVLDEGEKPVFLLPALKLGRRVRIAQLFLETTF